MNKSYLVGSVFTLLMGATNLASAVPVSSGPALSGNGNGLNARWVDTDFSPHGLANATSATLLKAGDTGFVKEINQVATSINFVDNAFTQSGNSGAISTNHTIVPLEPDDNFAVKYTGFINIKTEDTYSFNAFTDDGFGLTIGGEQISKFDTDRAPASTSIDVFLPKGFYSFEFVGWEQGGQFVNELSWHNKASTNFSVINSDVLFTSAPVPVPTAFLLFGSGLLGLLGARIKAKANSIG